MDAESQLVTRLPAESTLDSANVGARARVIGLLGPLIRPELVVLPIVSDTLVQYMVAGWCVEHARSGAGAPGPA